MNSGTEGLTGSLQNSDDAASEGGSSTLSGPLQYKHGKDSNHSDSTGSRREPKIKLWSNMRERKKFDALRDLYAIIKTVEHLEIAYVRQACRKDEYTDACNALLSQFKEAQRILRTFPDISDVSMFMRKYKLECPRAEDRLVRVGQPATVQLNERAKNRSVRSSVLDSVNFDLCINIILLLYSSP